VNLEQVERIAEAVLYEGYMLYPYRPSSVKNQQRWNFGVLYPPSWCRQAGYDRSNMQTECLLKAESSTRLTVKIRFLQIVQRSVAQVVSLDDDPFETPLPDLKPVDRLEIRGRVYQPWQEAVERELSFEDLDPADFATMSPLLFAFPGGKSVEYLRDEQGTTAAALVRSWRALDGAVEIRSLSSHDEVVKITVDVENLTENIPAPSSSSNAREEILLHSLVSAHTILATENGEFLSLLEPPSGFEDVVAQCQNLGTWPVLATDNADAMLSSPIILYDYPQIAPESSGDFFDGTEMDEMLTLRVMTLSDHEKKQLIAGDKRGREILERASAVGEEQLMKVHGAIRGLRRVSGE